MRKKFAELLYDKMSLDPKIVLITGDLGYGLWDKIKMDYPNRFFNVGSAEQFMIGMSVGMAMEGKIPFAYSITPFLLYRPFEFIRNYLHKDQIPVNLIGGGRDDDYGSLGYSHWAKEDRNIITNFDIESFWPEDESSLEEAFSSIVTNNKPSYLNLRR